MEIADVHAGSRVVVVTHGGILDDFYRFVSGVAQSVDREWDLFNCGINRLRTDGERWWVDAWGDIEHLDGIGSMADWNEEGQ